MANFVSTKQLLAQALHENGFTATESSDAAEGSTQLPATQRKKQRNATRKMQPSATEAHAPASVGAIGKATAKQKRNDPKSL